MTVDPHRLPGPQPLAARVLVLPDQFLFLGVHADHRLTGRLMFAGLRVDVPKLRIPVRVLRTFEDLDVGLQAETVVPQQIPDQWSRYPMPGRGQLAREDTGRLRRPPQR
jgi:hypothetical protein